MSAHSDDPALETLFLPFLDERLDWPAASALFLRARAGSVLQRDSWPGLICEQTFKPDADALARAGVRMLGDEPGGKYPLVLLLPPRQRAEARALMARAVECVASGGRVVACATNNEGARSSEADLAQLAGPLETLTKNKCRVFWSAPLNGTVDAALAREWHGLDAVRTIENGRFVSRPGVFAWDRIDVASALLASHLPPGLVWQRRRSRRGFRLPVG